MRSHRRLRSPLRLAPRPRGSRRCPPPRCGTTPRCSASRTATRSSPRLHDGRRWHVRVLGIDTHEVLFGQHECGGLAGSRAMHRLLPRGTRVRLAADPAQVRVDRYHRLLRYVQRASDGLDVGRAQARRRARRGLRLRQRALRPACVVHRGGAGRATPARGDLALVLTQSR
ncbi:hypothetical protein G5V59_00795 [Nocardioides sp. W3-2-3]|uniref:hypothetical protein n=1 Tax=Nocardioides convexus TaxID=2712224 RepID=UPI002418AC88|nr:hypothetical protein [Nocardioides convexus]NGZ99468.1 hypothetical protein [Nocardioides convexus]